MWAKKKKIKKKTSVGIWPYSVLSLPIHEYNSVRIVVGLLSFYHTDALSQICIPGFPIVAQFVMNLKECPGGCGFNP